MLQIQQRGSVHISHIIYRTAKHAQHNRANLFFNCKRHSAAAAAAVAVLKSGECIIHNVCQKVGVRIGEAHRRLDPEHISVQATLAHQHACVLHALKCLCQLSLCRLLRVRRVGMWRVGRWLVLVMPFVQTLGAPGSPSSLQSVWAVRYSCPNPVLSSPNHTENHRRLCR